MENTHQSTSFGWIAERYISTRGGEERVHQIISLLVGFINPGSIVLDVGAGPAQIASNLTTSRKVICLDISTEMAKVAAGVSRSVVQADAQQLPVSDQSVDAALMLWVLNHIANPIDAIREIHRVLRASGRLIYLSGIPVHPSWDTLGKILCELDEFRQANLESECMVTSIAKSAGFSIRHEGNHVVRFRQRPRGLARRIRDRSYGHLRNLDDEGWHKTVVPVLDKLNRLPNPNSYYERQNMHRFIVFEKNPSAEILP